jgi:NADPH-dependent ferric siderophore reductase
MRTYTPRCFNPSTGELSIDIFLHGDGPGAAWARRAVTGEHLKISVPRSTWSPPADADWLLVAGDDSAIPAIATILEGQTPDNTRVLVESESVERNRLALPPSASIDWLAARPKSPSAALEAAIADFVHPEGSGVVWVACEAMAVRRIRRTLIDQRMMASDSIVTRGYWREGESNHPDHDFGED